MDRTQPLPSLGTRSLFLAPVILLAGLAGRAEAAVVWPDNELWTVVTSGGSPVVDPDGTVPEGLDLRGTSAYPVGFVAYDFAHGGNLLFRMRVDAYPLTPISNRVWQVLIDSDGDDDVEWSLQLDYATHSRVELVAATSGGPTYNSLLFAAGGAWTGTTGAWSRIVATNDGNQFDPAPDVFVDIAIRMADFQAQTGLSTSSSFRIAMSTSTTDAAVNRDRPGSLAGTGLVASGWSDAFTADDVTAVPEPGTWALFALGTGLLAWRVRRRRQRTPSVPASDRAAS